MDELLAGAAVVTTLAAVGALVFAWLTVREARAARAEERHDRELQRLYRVLELVGAVPEAVSVGNAERIAVARLRLDSAVSGDLNLTACKELVSSDDADAFEVYLDAQEEVARRIEAVRRSTPAHASRDRSRHA